jgi:hypothetical protein
MKIDLSIYNRILFDDLRPWIAANTQETKFQNKITAGFKNPKGGSDAFEKAIKNALKDWKHTNIEQDYIFEIEEDNEQFKGIADEISEPLIEVEAPEPNNTKQEFYFFLIRNEGTRLINNLHKAVQLGSSDSEKKATVVSTIYKINSLLTDIDKQKKLLQKNQEAAQKKNNDFIFAILKNTLIRLHLEMKEVFPTLLSGKAFDEEGIIENILQETYTGNSIIKNKVGLNSFAVKRYINNEKYSKTKTVELINQTLENIVNHFSTIASTKEEAERKSILHENIKALENLYYANEFNLVEERPNYDTLLSDEFNEAVFTKASEALTEIIEEHNLGSKRLPVIAKEELKLSFLQAKIQVDESVFTLSIPRRIKLVLDFAKAAANANLSVDLKQALEGRSQRIKTKLSQEELVTFFRMLDDLKPEIFDYKTKTELFKFIATNFESKKSKGESLSEGKVKNIYYAPDSDAADFWQKHLHTMLAHTKKIKGI